MKFLLLHSLLISSFALCEYSVLENLLIPIPKPKEKPNYKVREIRIETGPKLECPIGYYRVENKCEQIEKILITKVCKEGWLYEKQTNKCVGYDVKEPKAVCEDGTLENNECIEKITLPVQLYCNEGFTLDFDTVKCIAKNIKNPIITCPPNTISSNGHCLEIDKRNFEYRCPFNYKLIDGDCIKIEYEEPMMICPPGHELHGSVCKSMKIHPFILTCSKGELVNDYCNLSIMLKPKLTCPNKYMFMNDNLCKVEQIVEGSYMCKPGLILNPISHQCEGDSVVNGLPECPPGMIYNKHTSFCQGIKGKKAPNIACPPDYMFFNKHQCTKKITTPGMFVCPEGFRMYSKEKCVKEIIEQPLLQCPDNFKLINNACVNEERILPDKTCPNGFQIGDHNCFQKVMINPLYKCESNAILANDNKCIYKHKISTIRTCPEGYIEVNERTDYCQKTTNNNIMLQCKAPWILEDNNCIETLVEEPSKTCPTNYAHDLSNELCYKTNVFSKIAVCAKGYTLAGNKCLRKTITDLINVCPEGYINEDNESCRRTVVEDLIIICPIGFTYDKSEKICYTIKAEYEFDANTIESTNPVEDLKDLSVPTQPEITEGEEVNETTTTETPEAEVEISLRRPIIEKGLVMKDEEIILKGPSQAVTVNSELIQSGVNLNSLKDVNIQYIPPIRRLAEYIYNSLKLFSNRY